MPPDSETEGPDPEKLREESQQSIEKVRDLADELRTVHEHEGTLLHESTLFGDEPPLFRPKV